MKEFFEKIKIIVNGDSSCIVSSATNQDAEKRSPVVVGVPPSATISQYDSKES